MNNKTIFISIYDGDTEKNVLRSGTFAHLKNAGHRIVLLIRGKDRLEYYRAAFADKQVAIELLPHATTTIERLWYFLGWNTLPTRSARLRRHMWLAKGWSRTRFAIGTTLGILAHIRAWRELLRFVYSIVPDDYAKEMFEKYKPDLLFAPNMFSPEDFRLLRQAKRRGVKTAATAKSWDVLTPKAFTRVRADRLLVFNEFNRQEAIALGDYRQENIVVTGFPQFDIYAREEIFMPRDVFMRSIGADPAKRMALIAVPGDWKTPYTQEIMKELDRRIDAGHYPVPLQILARFHPKYPDSSEKLHLKNFIFDRPGTHLSDKKEFSVDMGIANTYAWTFKDKDLVRLANSLKHSDVVINTESTLSLDASANDTPVILIGYDGDRQVPYWDSVERIYEREHYSHVVETHAAPLVKSHDELENAIKQFLDNPEYLRKEREILKKNMLFKTDGRSAERVANAVLELL